MCVIDCRNRQSLNALASAVENIRKNNRIEKERNCQRIFWDIMN